VENIAPPVELTGQVTAFFKPAGGGDLVNGRSSRDYCINYPFLVSDNYPSFRLGVSFESDVEPEPVLSDFAAVNAGLSSYGFVADTGRAGFDITPTDPTAVCYVTYKGFIIFVGNYN
jgi:hypothetical protein